MAALARALGSGHLAGAAVPGVLADINRIVSDVHANIESQVLATDSSTGYLVMDRECSHAGPLLTRRSGAVPWRLGYHHA